MFFCSPVNGPLARSLLARTFVKRGFPWFLGLVLAGLLNGWAEEPRGLPVWETGPARVPFFVSPAAIGPEALQSSVGITAGLSVLGAQSEPAFQLGVVHWKNVPRSAWLLLAGCVGLLGLYGFWRTRPPRPEAVVRSIEIIGERREDPARRQASSGSPEEPLPGLRA